MAFAPNLASTLETSWSAAFPEIPSGRADGPEGHRPAEKQVEAKEIVKVLADAVVVPKRIAMPRGMLLGGGSSDFAARRKPKDAYPGGGIKDLIWATEDKTVTIKGKGSIYRDSLFPFGPLAKMAAAIPQGAEVDVKEGIGIPIDIGAIRRAQGALTYVTEHSFEGKLGADGKLNVGVSMYANDKAAEADGYGNWKFCFQHDVKAGLHQGGVRLVYTFKPWTSIDHDAKDIDYGRNDIAITCECQVITNLLAAAITPTLASKTTLVEPSACAPDFGIAETSLMIQPTNRAIWLDAALTWNAVARNESTDYIKLHRSNGYTLSGHDGLPYDWNDAF